MTWGHRLITSYSLSCTLLCALLCCCHCKNVAYLVCSFPGVLGLVAFLAEQELSKQVLYRGTTWLGIHLWTQRAQQSENDKDNMTWRSQFFSQWSKFNCGLHSSMEKCSLDIKTIVCWGIRKKETIELWNIWRICHRQWPQIFALILKDKYHFKWQLLSVFIILLPFFKLFKPKIRVHLFKCTIN